MSTKLNLAASIAFAWNSLTVDQYAARKKNPDLGQPSLFETSHQPHLKDLGAGRWITIHAGQGESGNHGGHAVFVGDDGKMKTGKFAGKSMSEAFGARKPKDKRLAKRGAKHEQGQPGLFETETQPTLPGVGPGNFIDQGKLRALGKEAKEKEPKPGLIPGSTSVKNEDAKAGDQLGLFGEGEKAKPKPWKPTLLDTKGKAGTLFDTKGDKDQMLAFDVDGATPEDRLQKPQTSEKKPDQAVVNVPLSKRGNIDNQIDKFKAEQAAAAKQKRSESFQQKKVDKAKARELFDQHADALAEATAAKGGNTKAEAKKHLDSMVKWQPAQAVKMLEGFAKQRAKKNEPSRLSVSASELRERLSSLRDSITGVKSAVGEQEKSRAIAALMKSADHLSSAHSPRASDRDRSAYESILDEAESHGWSGNRDAHPKRAWEKTWEEHAQDSIPDLEKKRQSSGTGGRDVPRLVGKAAEEHKSKVEAAVSRGESVPSSALKGHGFEDTSPREKASWDSDSGVALSLDRGFSFWKDGIPYSHSKASQSSNVGMAAEHLAKNGGKVVSVKFEHHGDRKLAKRYMERLQKLAEKAGYDTGSESVREVSGHTFDGHSVVALTRNTGAEIDKPEKDRHSVGFRPLLLDRPASVTFIVDRYWNTIRNDDLYLAPESPVVDRYDWNSAQHPRHPAGAPRGAGGEFSGHGGGSAAKGFAQSNRLGAVSASIASQWGNKPAAAMPSVKRELAHLPQIDRSHALHRSQLGPHVDSQLLNWSYRMHELLRPMDKMPPTVTKLSGDEQAEAGWAKVDKNKVRAMLEELNQMDRDMKAKGVPLSDYVNASGIIPRELAVRLDGGSRFFNPELLGNKLRDGRREPEEKPSEKPSPAQPEQPKRAAAEAKPNKPAPAPIPSGMSKVGSNKLNGIVSEVVGDADPAKKEHFRQVALDAWKQMCTDAEDHNTAVREIMGQFTKAGHGGIAAALKKGADPTKIRGFDEMVDYAAREFPSVVSHMAGESESGSAEEGLIKALTKGIQPIPQPWDDEVIDRAIEMVGPMFFEEYQPDPANEEDLEPIPFAAKMERAREMARYWLRSEPERYAASADIAKPTEAQKLAGNYRMGHVRIHGLDITIETPKGRSRRDGWPKLSCDYGYFKKTLGRDGDHVDVFIGPDKTSEMVYVIDQPNGRGGFDEHKVLIGFRSQNAAVAAYRDCYTTGWIVGKVTAMTVEQFKAWLAKGSQNKPIAGQVSRYWEKHSLTERYASSSRQ